MSFTRYPEYEDTELDWFREIPKSWAIRKLNGIADVLAGYSFNSDSFCSNGIPVIRMSDFGKGQIFQENAKFVPAESVPISAFGKEEDILLGLSGSIGNFAVIKKNDLPVAINQRVAIIRSTSKWRDLLPWLLQSIEFKIQIESQLPATTIQNISMEQLRKVVFPIPPNEKIVQKITEFLINETAKIESLITEQEKLISLLKEKRQAVISHSATKGLDTKVNMKDSGVEWLGDVPEHWDLSKGRNIFKIKKRIVGELGYDVLSITQKGIRIKDIESNEGQLSMDYSKYQLVEIGDFAMNHMDLLTGYVDLSKFNGVTSPDYRVFSIQNKDTCYPEYFLYLLQNGYSNKIFYPYGQGSSQLGRWRLPTEEFKEFCYPLPSIDEQKKIASFISKETKKMDALIYESNQGIQLLQERRSALISAVVTGQIDVRNYQSKEAA